MKLLKRLQCILDHSVVKVLAALLQIGGVVGLIAFWAVVMFTKKDKIPVDIQVYVQPLVGLPLVLLALSIVWSSRFQEAIAKSGIRKDEKKVSARYKSGECYM